MAVTTKINLSIVSSDNGDVSGQQTGSIRHVVDYVRSLADGTSANQADIVYTASDSVTASGTDNIDLAGSLSDAFGNTLTYVEIVGLVVVNKNTTSGDTIDVTPGASNGISTILGGTDPTIEVGPGGVLVLFSPVDGYGVTAGTHDILSITETGGANAVTYDIYILGRTA